MKITSSKECSYPECRCPFDMGVDNKCLIGLEKKKAVKAFLEGKSIPYTDPTDV